jgi:hypothetical protein
MKQFLFLAAIYSLVFYQSQKNKKNKSITPVVHQSIAQAAAYSVKSQQPDFRVPGFRYADINSLYRTGSSMTRTRWDNHD